MRPPVEYLQNSTRMQSQSQNRNRYNRSVEWETKRKIAERSKEFHGKKFTVLIEFQVPVFDNGHRGFERINIKLTKGNSYLYLSEDEAVFLMEVLHKEKP